jgi:3-dehydroquinate synthase
VKGINELVKFEDEGLTDFNDLLQKIKFSKIFFLVDENTHEHCLIRLLQELPEVGEYEVLEVEAGEDSKSPEVLVQLWQALSELEADRSSLLVNVGGGVITDLGGFLASTYMRGITFVNFPTTVLAQVDASVGGKTGINLNHLKNRVGVFQNPNSTYLINSFLESLPIRERLSGFAEMLKHALIADPDYWLSLKTFDIENSIPTQEMIQRSVEIKFSIIEKDFRESDIRKGLNFGHTIGHSLETAALAENESLLHGEAIAIGMQLETLLSVKYTGLSSDIAQEICDSIHVFFPNVKLHGNPDLWVELMKEDKKNVGDEFRFSLLKNIGSVEVDVPVQEKDIIQVLKQIV